MDPLVYKVLMFVTCVEDPKPKLVGVCNYDVYVTPERISGLHAALQRDFFDSCIRFNTKADAKENLNVLEYYVNFNPMDPAEMDATPDPMFGVFGRIPKNVNSCINTCMRDVHRLLYPLMKPVR